MFTMTKKKITPQEYEQKKKEITEARREEMRRLKEVEGWTLQQIADYFDVDKSLVSRIIKGER